MDNLLGSDQERKWVVLKWDCICILLIQLKINIFNPSLTKNSLRNYKSWLEEYSMSLAPAV